ncbi:MAG: serine/threonine protein kinase [Myxococcales bacterium]|nr:serine/threonine protein kinase [Myxococcales bacterium]MCB9714665.1 serine/threonine protein kinase [Myxococcales bacterium]
MDARESSPRSGGVDDTLADEDLSIARVDRLQRGEGLGRYVVLDPLGAGAVGLVYAAYDPELDRRVAIKLLRASPGLHPGSRRSQRLLREAQAMARLAHPNVVTVHDVGTHEDRVFLAMEHVQGQTLGRWLGSSRPWDEVLEVFLAAGRGLAAAHAKGLVHRDFKPDNVMLGDDGRVLVMDFGLARVGEGSESESEEPSGSGPNALSARITHTGAMLGTPAYMAPEQHLGRSIDARSDQFAFCVALFEGLYGQRPFAGETAASVGMSIIEGRITEPPAGRGVPRGLHRALLRGLARDPAERYADMDELMRALRASLHRRRSAGLAVAGVGLAVAAGLWASAADDGDGPCAAATAELDETWNEPRRRGVAEAIETTGSPMAAETIERVTERLDRYAEDWGALRTARCEATRLRGEQSEVLLELQYACLDRRLRSLEDLVGVLEQADADMVARAVSMAAELPPLTECADVVALRRGPPPPADPQLARSVQALRERLEHAQVLARAGRFDEARALASQLRQDADDTGYDPVRAEALATEGELAAETGADEDAVGLLSRAFFLAVRAQHDELAARAAARLTYEIGYRLAHHEQGFAWGEHALALGLRVGEDALPEAEAHHAIGALADAAGDTERANEHYSRALELRRRLLPADHPDLARSLNALGNVHLHRGELLEALELYRAALEARERVFGPHHPAVAGALNNLALVQRRQGDAAAAIATLRRALEIYEAVHGEDHPNVAQSRNNLGLALRDGGDPVAAEAQHRRALAIRERILPPEHPDLGDSRLGLGRALLAQGRAAEAQPELERALQLYERAFGPDHPAVGEALTGLGLARLERGESSAAVDALTRALVVLDAKAPRSAERDEAAAGLERARLSAASEPASPAPPAGSPPHPPARDRPPAPAG